MKDRVLQLDFLKGIFIILMIVYHNHAIADSYPLVAQILASVHMPAFLIISGYLANVDKELPIFCKGMLRLIVPYTIFEILYVVMIFLLGKVMNTSNQIPELSPLVILDKLLLNPIGTYWYIHTLIICTTVYYIVCHVLKFKNISALAVMGVTLFGLSLVIENLKIHNVIYFLFGVFIVMSGKNFISFITPSAFAIVPLCLLIRFSDDISRGTLPGVAITILSISFLLFVFDHCALNLKKILVYLGQNSLAIVVFSPVFTIVGNKLIPYFSFDQTRLVFTSVTLVITASGCMLCAWISDKIGLSRYLFCKKNFYVGYKTISC